MNVLDVLSKATEAAQAASEAYEKSVVAAREVDASMARSLAAKETLEGAKKRQEDATAAVQISFQRLAQQVKATSLAGDRAVSVARGMVEERVATVASAESALVLAKTEAAGAKARVDRAVSLAENAARIRDAVIMASEVTDSSAEYGKTKEAAFTSTKVAEARAASIQAANDASVQAATVAEAAAKVYQIASEAENRVQAAQQSQRDAEMALSMAQSAQVAIVKAIEAMNAIGRE